jgi:hypothetical protein
MARTKAKIFGMPLTRLWLKKPENRTAGIHYCEVAMRQNGFGSITLYAIIGAAVVIAGLTIALKVQSSRLEAVRSEYAGFVAQVKAAGEVAQAKAKAKEAVDKQLKEKIDHENKTLRTNLADAANRLRNASASSGRLPQVPASPGGAATAPIDTAELNRALREYFEGERRRDSAVAGLVIEGAENATDLNSAKEWAKALK